jgi:hypothetical protein
MVKIIYAVWIGQTHAAITSPTHSLPILLGYCEEDVPNMGHVIMEWVVFRLRERIFGETLR